MSKFFMINNIYRILSVTIILIWISVPANGSSSGKIGVISLHAKWSMPSKHAGWWEEMGKLKIFKKKFQNKCGKGPWRCSEDKTIVGHKKADLRFVEFALHDEGILIESPHCAWSRLRKYDLPVDEALRECITPRIERLKKRGAEKIVILGKSLGANMAIRAGVIFDGISGVVAMGPGHRPAKPYIVEKHLGDVAHALNKIKNGKGDKKTEYLDINQGSEMQVSISAKSYHSFFSPDGSAVMALNVPKMKNKAALLWIVGDLDIITTNGDGRRIYNTAAKKPKTRYIKVNGGHDEVGENGADKIVEWIKRL